MPTIVNGYTVPTSTDSADAPNNFATLASELLPKSQGGVLPIANGGTGENNISDIRKALGICRTAAIRFNQVKIANPNGGNDNVTGFTTLNGGSGLVAIDGATFTLSSRCLAFVSADINMDGTSIVHWNYSLRILVGSNEVGLFDWDSVVVPEGSKPQRATYNNYANIILEANTPYSLRITSNGGGNGGNPIFGAENDAMIVFTEVI